MHFCFFFEVSRSLLIILNLCLLPVRWLEIFKREQLLIVNGDQLIEDPLTQIRRIEDFLGKYYELQVI